MEIVPWGFALVINASCTGCVKRLRHTMGAMRGLWVNHTPPIPIPLASDAPMQRVREHAKVGSHIMNGTSYANAMSARDLEGMLQQGEQSACSGQSRRHRAELPEQFVPKRVRGTFSRWCNEVQKFVQLVEPVRWQGQRA